MIEFDNYCEWIGPEAHPSYYGTSYKEYYNTSTQNTVSEINFSALSRTEWYANNYGTLAGINRMAETSPNTSIQTWYPTGMERSIEVYRKATPMWLQDLQTLNTLGKMAGVCLLFSGYGTAAGLGFLGGTSWVDAGITLVEATKYETKTIEQFGWQFGAVLLTQGVASSVTEGLAASYLKADAGLVGNVMYEGSRFYTTYNASGMSRYLSNAYSLSVVGTGASANAVEEFMNRLYPGRKP